MRKFLVAKKITDNKWKAKVRFALGKEDIAPAVLAVVTIGYVAIRSLIA